MLLSLIFALIRVTATHLPIANAAIMQLAPLVQLAPLTVVLAEFLLPAQTDSKPPHVAIAQAVLQGADHITAIAAV